MPKTYFNDALVGNSSMLGCITSEGELVRLFWPHIDYMQNIDRLLCGIYIKGWQDGTMWLGRERWTCRQQYMPFTNILETTFECDGKGISIKQTDFVLTDSDVMVRHYYIKNKGRQALEPGIMLYSSVITSSNEPGGTLFDFRSDALTHYKHGYYLSISGSRETSGFQVGNNAFDSAGRVSLYGSDNIGMSSDGAVSWELGMLEPEEETEFTLYICASDTLNGTVELSGKTRENEYDILIEETKEYWKDFLEKAQSLKNIAGLFPEDGAFPAKKSDGIKAVENLYTRSLLVFKLLADKKTGGIIASAEVDEEFSRCGRYAYCWGRDAGFITGALDKCGLAGEVESFYRWAVKAQNIDGSWHQRYYTDGNLAPSWGLQVDETGTVVWGILQHYKMTGNKAFLKEVWDCVKKAAGFLAGFIDAETGLPAASFDIWEERYGEHAYSSAAVYAGLMAAAELARLVGAEQDAASWERIAGDIRKAVDRNFWDNSLERFIRSVRVKLNPWGSESSHERLFIKVNPKGYERDVTPYDYTLDISLLGLSVPFELYDASDEKIKKTADTIEKMLFSPGSGGIMRYENDSYIGGNPWLIATLWLALYYIKSGHKDKAKELFFWAVKSRTSLDMLPEQADKQTGQPAWVIPLAWSHAMFVLVLFELLP